MTDGLSTDPQYQSLIKELEKVNGVPVVISRYGFKVTTVDGKKCLEAGTLDDAARALAEASKGRLTFEQARNQVNDPASRCDTLSRGGCVAVGCAGCDRVWTGAYFLCVCA
jgi:hypothetical protein